MSTNTDKYEVPIRAGWAWVLPNSVFDVPAIQVEVMSEDGLMTIPTTLSINDYLKTAEANVGLFQNRKVIPMAKGTHGAAFFDSDREDMDAFEAMLEANGLINGVRDFTLDTDNVFYSMPLTKYDIFLQESPLNVAPVEEMI